MRNTYRGSRRSRRRNRYGDTEDVNPMNFVSNLSDVMLILAVGIMLALILHWNVNIDTTDSSQTEEKDQADTITFDDNDLENKETLPEGAQEMGNVYYDPSTGTYYIITDGE